MQLRSTSDRACEHGSGGARGFDKMVPSLDSGRSSVSTALPGELTARSVGLHTARHVHEPSDSCFYTARSTAADASSLMTARSGWAPDTYRSCAPDTARVAEELPLERQAPGSLTTARNAWAPDTARIAEETPLRQVAVGTVQDTVEEAMPPLFAAVPNGWTPLHFHAAEGDIEACRALLAGGACLDSKLADWSTPLMLAADEGHLDIVSMLLEHGAAVNVKDESGFTALERCDPAIENDFRALLKMRSKR